MDKSIKEQLLLVKCEAPDVFAAVITATDGGICICPSYFGMKNACSKKVLGDCDSCWNLALKD